MSRQKFLYNAGSVMYSCFVMAQSQTSRTLRGAAARERVAAILSQEQFESRRSFGRRICREFSFVDATGRLQVAGCMKALAELAEHELGIVLPLPAAAAVDPTPRQLPGRVADPVDIPDHPSRIRGLEFAVASTPADRALWDTLIAREHPRGVTKFAGCQVRYLIGSAHGWLGAAGFSAAALNAADRDRWIAWNDEQRRDHLNRIVCLSRFLIRPSVRCPHLASHVLGRILRRLPRDFEARYGYRPWLAESFVDQGYEGTCLKAVGFVRVGETAGRGRQDRYNRHAETVKAVFMRALDSNWRRKLGVPHVDHAPTLEPGEGLNAADWAENEFGGAPLGDKRLSARLVKCVGLLAACPGRKINANSASDSTVITAFYRLIGSPAESAVTARNILAPHRERTIRRVRGQRTILAIQDGIDLNFLTSQGAKNIGLHLHATLAVTDSGIPLGVLRLGFDAVKDGPPEAAARWKTDCFELFDAQRRRPRVHLLARARHDRTLGEDESKLFALMGGSVPDGLIEIEIEDRTAGPPRLKRLAYCELRFRRAALPATEGAEPPFVSAVHVVETAPPDGEEPTQWRLLTTLDVRNAGDAAEVTGFYLRRRRIEDFFRVLKFDCRAESLLFRTEERLQRALAINAVIAWRIMAMTPLVGPGTPDCEPKMMFTDRELDFLRNYADEHGLPAPDRMGNTAQLIAHLGGCRVGKHVPDPERLEMRQGRTRLETAAMGYRIGFHAGREHALQQESRAVVLPSSS